MARGLFIGRFQPFHKGHLSVVRQATNEVSSLIIGIGSAKQCFTPENPFTAGERFEMIKKTLEKEKIKKPCIIIPVCNINNYSLWVTHLKSILPLFKTVYTGSPIVKTLFSDHKEFKLRSVKKNLKICASHIREKIVKGKNWENLVPNEVAKYIKKIRGIERIQNINCDANY